MIGLLVYLLSGVSHYILMRNKASRLTRPEHIGFFTLCVLGWIVLPVYNLLYKKS